MKLYPIFLNLAGRPCLVVGGGRVAFAKAQALHDAGTCLTVVSPAFSSDFDELPEIQRRPRTFDPGDVAEMLLAVAATDDPGVNRAVWEACRVQGVLCNVVDAPELCDFFVPSTLRRGSLTVAVSTGGAAPALAKRLRHDLEAIFPDGYGEYVRFLMDARDRVRAAALPQAVREQITASLASSKGYARFIRATLHEREAWLSDLVAQARREGAES